VDLLNLYTQDTLECLAVSAGWRQNYAEPNFKSIYIPTSSQSCHTFTSKQTEAKDFLIVHGNHTCSVLLNRQ